MMRIGIDARFLTHPQAGGFKTYSQSLVRALAQVDTHNQYVLYVDRPPEPQHAIPQQPNVTVRVVEGQRQGFGMIWREQWLLGAAAARDQLDLLHSPSLTAPLRLCCRSVVTIHDTIWLFPQRFASGRMPLSRRVMQQYYQIMPRLAARRAAAVITVSHDARRSIVAELGVDPARVSVTYEAAGPGYRPADPQRAQAHVAGRFGLAPGYLLALGSADPRKNVRGLLHAYAALPERLRSAHQLAIVWTHALLADEIAEQARALGVEGRVAYLRGVTNDDLVQLYSAAAAFVFPSRYEGFGLPLLEAMACATPVVAADNSSIPEVVGEAALLVDAEQPQGIAAAIARLLEDAELRGRLVREGLAQAARFSWERCARETLEVYQRACTQ